ncbi:MAG: hypothetical protein BGO03_09510 [Mesorhizobium sp. 61-13]|nr:MAG: hypothetical protein BGO03_09510 [Mesorhizobium sp. 61-13]
MTPDEPRNPRLKEYERDRRKALRERRKSWARDGIELETQFGPGSFGFHEAFHVSNMIVELMQRELLDHSAVLLDPEWYALVRSAQDSLYQAYLHAGRAHNGPTDSLAADTQPSRAVDLRKVRKITGTVQ